ncbi:hypothetical protein TPR58_12545 [Sphingomonas sp. HF-S3]|uniref:Uncharacterized protein n=1 Tax=Sphingomonas rustica TaxID=3103142 RepID=A0ABV0B9V8_9SPHN
MTRGARRPRRIYETTLDRAGHALGAGAGIGGLATLALVIAGGQSGPLQILAALLLGTIFCAIGIVAVAGPLWLVMHVAGLRRGHHAALVGAASALALLVGAQTWGFGLLDMPELDPDTRTYFWLSALATGGLVALVAAAIGLVMWRIAYRRVA